MGKHTVTRRPMSVTALTAHWTMIVMTGGLWTPVYLNARRKRKLVTKTVG